MTILFVFFVDRSGVASPIRPVPRSRLGINEYEIAGHVWAGFISIAAARYFEAALWHANPRAYQQPQITDHTGIRAIDAMEGGK